MANEWYIDSGATSQVTSNFGNLTPSNSSLKHNLSSIVVGNGSHLPIVATGSTVLTPHNFQLRDVLFSPHIVTNLISVREFTKHNSCSIEFYPFGFLVKDLRTRKVLMISASTDNLYPFFCNNKAWDTSFFTTISSSDVWHHRLGHPRSQALSSLAKYFLTPCNKISHSPCNACQLGRQPHLPFPSSSSRTFAPFDLIHCDLWTSPVVSFSGYQYYLIMLGDYSWPFPLLRNKSDTSTYLQRLFSFIKTQFNVLTKSMQCDNSDEFINFTLRSVFSTHGITCPFSCPHTSSQKWQSRA